MTWETFPFPPLASAAVAYERANREIGTSEKDGTEERASERVPASLSMRRVCSPEELALERFATLPATAGAAAAWFTILGAATLAAFEKRRALLFATRTARAERGSSLNPLESIVDGCVMMGWWERWSMLLTLPCPGCSLARWATLAARLLPPNFHFLRTRPPNRSG